MQWRARVIAFFLPQYHVVPENEVWWGEQFTDWVNVRRARPLFDGHYQPRVPLKANYYDLSHRQPMAEQIEMARNHGIEGFCHYHYWFGGRRILEGPTERLIGDRSLDFPFCLCWVNASWSRRWKGDRKPDHILVRQRYPRSREAWRHHFDCLIRAWEDPRHIRVGGKPVFLIYNPHEIPRAGDMLGFWRDEAAKRGIDGIHIVAVQLFSFPRHNFLKHFDAVATMQPSHAMFVPGRGDSLFSRTSLERFVRGLPPLLAEPLRDLRYRARPGLTTYDYERLWEKAVSWRPLGGMRTYPGAFVDWDNTPRYGEGGRVVLGADPRIFGHFFGRLVDSVQSFDHDDRLIFLNAWNEWAEGAYLEPDERFGFGYLEAVRDAL